MAAWGHAFGVYAGVGLGLALWFYCLMLPQLVSAGELGQTILAEGAFGVSWLRPTALFGVTLRSAESWRCFGLWDLNAFCYVLVSLWTPAKLQDRLQAVAFVKPNLPLQDDDKLLKRRHITGGDLQILLGAVCWC